MLTNLHIIKYYLFKKNKFEPEINLSISKDSYFYELKNAFKKQMKKSLLQELQGKMAA